MNFADFWQLYPRKVAKKDAEKAWSKLTDIQQTQALKTIQLHAKVWRHEMREQHTIPHAATWLNGWRFEDEITVPLTRQEMEARCPALPGETTEQWQARLRLAQQ